MMELFCGTGRLHRAFQRRGWRAQGLDLIRGDDLAAKACQDTALARIRSGQCRLVWLGTPCSTFSRARRGPRTHHGPPPPLRSTEHPWGLPDLTQHELEVVAVSNVLMKFTLQVIRLCIHHKVAVALENPMSSIMWCVPELLTLFSRGGQECKTDLCCWGETWRKSTRVWSWNADLSAAAKRCSGRGVCSRTNNPHVTLSGLDSHRVFWTKRAEQYPVSWTAQLAKIFDFELHYCKNMNTSTGLGVCS